MDGFFQMGGYAAFVWPSLIVTALIMATVWEASRRALRRAEDELRTLEEASEPEKSQ